MGKPGEFYYLLCLLLTDVTDFSTWGSGDFVTDSFSRQVKCIFEDWEHQMRPNLIVSLLSVASGCVCWSHPVNGLQSILEVCQAAAGFPAPGRPLRLVGPVQVVTKDN